MVSLTAIIRCKPDTAEAVLKALMAVGDYVKAHEPDTLGYTVTRSGDPAVLLTHEVFKDGAAMEAHNAGKGSQTFFAVAKDLLENVSIHTGDVVFSCERSA